MLFCEKFDYLLSVTGLSNSKLSKKMNVDASLISKWRRGVKIPSKRIYIDQICDAVAPSFRTETLREDLSRSSGIPTGELDTFSKAKAALISWLGEDAAISARQARETQRHGAEPVFDRLSTHTQGRKSALQNIAAIIMAADSIPCLRIYSDEPYEWMQVFTEHLDDISKRNPTVFSRIGRVNMLLSARGRGEKEYRCSWDVMNYFTDSCEVSVAMTDDRYSEIFQHAILIAGEIGAITSFGFHGSCGAFSLTHRTPGVIRELIDHYDALFNRSRIIMKEYPHYSAWEEAQSFKEMLNRNYDIYYRTYDIPPAFVPEKAIPRLLYRADDNSAATIGMQDAFRCDLEGFLKHNRLYSTLPLLRPHEVEAGMCNLPHTGPHTAPKRGITVEDYLDIMTNTLALYDVHKNLVLKAIAPSEVDYDCLAQEMNQFSLSKMQPRKYTYIATHQGVVTNAIRQLERYFVDAPITAVERKHLSGVIRDIIEDCR